MTPLSGPSTKLSDNYLLSFFMGAPSTGKDYLFFLVRVYIFDSDNETVLGAEEKDDIDEMLFERRRNVANAKADVLIGRIHAVSFFAFIGKRIVCR